MRVHTTRPHLPTALDAPYATEPRGARVPTLLAPIPRRGCAPPRVVAMKLLRRWTRAADDDWRAWSWGRSRAAGAVAAHAAELRAVCPPAAAANTAADRRPTAQPGYGD